ncbi:MAG: hypothetical protein ACO3RV_08715 [Luteolibacter sp.]
MPALVDSSGWIEFFVGGPNCDHFETAIHDTGDLIVPSVINSISEEPLLADFSFSILKTMKSSNLIDLRGQEFPSADP